MKDGDAVIFDTCSRPSSRASLVERFERNERERIKRQACAYVCTAVILLPTFLSSRFCLSVCFFQTSSSLFRNISSLFLKYSDVINASRVKIEYVYVGTSMYINRAYVRTYIVHYVYPCTYSQFVCAFDFVCWLLDEIKCANVYIQSSLTPRLRLRSVHVRIILVHTSYIVY